NRSARLQGGTRSLVGRWRPGERDPLLPVHARFGVMAPGSNVVVCRRLDERRGDFMRRRDFIALAGSVAAFPRLALAQQAVKLPHVAFLDTPRGKDQTDGFFQGLADRGYVDGKNIAVDMFIAPTTNDLPVFAAKAIASGSAVILAANPSAALDAEQL